MAIAWLVVVKLLTKKTLQNEKIKWKQLNSKIW